MSLIPSNAQHLTTDTTTAHQWHTAYGAWLLNFTSERTRKAYNNAWLFFQEFIENTPQRDILFGSDRFCFEAVQQDHIIAYKAYMIQQQGYSQSTVNLRLSGLSSFYTFAIERGLIADNPVDGVKRASVNPYGKATYMKTDDNEHKKFLAQIDRSTTQGKRDYAIMLIFLTTGVRAAAITGAYVKHIQQRASDWYLEYINKGGETDYAKITAVLPFIQDYFNTRGIQIDKRTPLDDAQPLFVATQAGRKAMRHTGHESDTLKPLSHRTINNLVRKYAKRAGLDGITPHSLRHTAAMHAAKHGTISEVSKLLRHKNTRITSIYLDHVDNDTADHLADVLADDYL